MNLQAFAHLQPFQHAAHRVGQAAGRLQKAEGMAGGGQGKCDLPNGGSVDAVFPRT